MKEYKIIKDGFEVRTNRGIVKYKETFTEDSVLTNSNSLSIWVNLKYIKLSGGTDAHTEASTPPKTRNDDISKPSKVATSGTSKH